MSAPAELDEEDGVVVEVDSQRPATKQGSGLVFEAHRLLYHST